MWHFPPHGDQQQVPAQRPEANARERDTCVMDASTDQVVLISIFLVHPPAATALQWPPFDRRGGDAEPGACNDAGAPDDDQPIHLVQYTNAEPLLSVVSTREIWAGHVFFMNDEQEFLHAYEQAVALFWHDPTFEELGERAPRPRDLMRTDRAQFQSRDLPAVFVASFSAKFNDLSQWRG